MEKIEWERPEISSIKLEISREHFMHTMGSIKDRIGMGLTEAEEIKKKWITSPGWMHETSARTWCTGKSQRNRVEREVGGGLGWGIHVNPWLIHVNV